MAYTLSLNLVLDEADTGLSLEAQLIDTVGASVGSAVTSGFVEVGLGNYLWTYAAFPDGFRGGVKFQLTGGGTLQAFVAVNPQDAENQDAKVTTRSSQTSVDTIAAYVDTEVAAIKAKTDQLTFTVANRVDAQVLGMGTDTLSAAALAADAVAEIAAAITIPASDCPTVEEIDAYLSAQHGSTSWGGSSGTPVVEYVDNSIVTEVVETTVTAEIIEDTE